MLWLEQLTPGSIKSLESFVLEFLTALMERYAWHNEPGNKLMEKKINFNLIENDLQLDGYYKAAFIFFFFFYFKHYQT